MTEAPKRMKLSMSDEMPETGPVIMIQFTEDGVSVTTAGFETAADLHGTMIDLTNSVAAAVVQERKQTLDGGLQYSDARQAERLAQARPRFNPKPSMGGQK